MKAFQLSVIYIEGKPAEQPGVPEYMAKKKENNIEQWTGNFKGLGRELAFRVIKSLLFWGMAGMLMVSSFRDLQKIEDSAGGDLKEFSRSVSAEAGIRGGTRSEISVTGDRSEAGIRGGAGNDISVTEDRSEAGIRPGGGGDTPVTEAPREDGEEKRVALTFDDGPHPVYTAELLDGLKERGVPATFFVVGKNIPGNEELIRRMDQEGHLIGNHTYDHVKISCMANDQACAQVESTSALVREITGKNTEFVRPPFGSWDKSLECSFVMIPVLWDVDPLDWTTKNADLVVERVLKDVEPGDIILLHDYYDSSVKAALRIVDALQDQGYEFVTVDQLILE